MIRMNGLEPTYDANLSTVQSIARHSRSVAKFFALVTDHLWLAWIRIFSKWLENCVSTAPAPISLASVRGLNGLF